jgi:hypothetical protein
MTTESVSTTTITKVLDNDSAFVSSAIFAYTSTLKKHDLMEAPLSSVFESVFIGGLGAFCILFFMPPDLRRLPFTSFFIAVGSINFARRIVF